MATTTAMQPGLMAPGMGTGQALATTGGNIANQNNPAAGAGGLLAPVKSWAEQPQVRKALPYMLLAVALLLFGLAYTWINAPTYRPLLNTVLSEADQQSALEALRQAEFKPVLDQASGQITVPSNRYHEARIFLASKGLPKSGPAGLDGLKDQSAMTTSQFMEQVRYVAAMEQELARTILQIQSIQNARVHLAMPKQSAFVRDKTPPKASVVITPYPGRSVTQDQVQALIHLVSSSIPNMNPDNVTVVDHQGKLFTETSTEAALGMTSAQAQHKQKLEELYRQRVTQILSPIVGDANVRSQVNMTLDFTQSEFTSEDYDRRDKGPKTRSESLSEDKISQKEAGGVPGSLSNTAPPTPTTTTQTAASSAPPVSGESQTNATTNSRSTRNFELDRSVRHVKEATGNVQRLSVAVVIKERPPLPGTKNDKGEVGEAKPNPYGTEELEQMQALVRGVVGYNQERGDVVTVVQAKFEPEQVIDLSIPWYKDDTLLGHLKTALLGLVFVAFLMLVVRPVVMSTIKKDEVTIDPALLANTHVPLPDGELTEADLANIQLGEGETLEDIKAKLKPKKSNIPLEMLDTANTYDDKVALVRMIVADDTARVASVLKNMIKGA